eukprot:scaffold6761_cov159-Amphora_coffeaeformis.AAC.4
MAHAARRIERRGMDRPSEMRWIKLSWGIRNSVGFCTAFVWRTFGRRVLTEHYHTSVFLQVPVITTSLRSSVSGTKDELCFATRRIVYSILQTTIMVACLLNARLDA